MICFTSCSFFSFISFLIFFLFLIHRLFCHLNFFVIYFLTTFCSHHRVVVVAWSFKDGVSEIVELRILDRDEIHFPLNLLSRESGRFRFCGHSLQGSLFDNLLQLDFFLSFVLLFLALLHVCLRLADGQVFI